MDEVRQMLDQLMGQDRNLSREERKHYRPKTRSYRDKDVCKYFLVGFCPYDEFRRTKNDCGDCPCIHDEDAKREWDGLDDRTKERSGYEDDLKRWMDRLLVDLQKRIDTNTERLQATEKPLFLVEDKQRLDGMMARINELLARSQALGEQGDVDGAQAAMMEAEQVKVQRSILEQQAQARAGNNAAKNLQQAVCPISGLIINKEESRIQDHEMGKNYNSWRKLHEVHARLLDIFRRREEARRRERYGDRGSDRRDSRGSSHRDRDTRGGYRDDRGRDSRRRDEGRRDDRSGRDYRSGGDRREPRRDRDRSPARPSRPRVDEADFVVEYHNEEAAAKHQPAATGAAGQYFGAAAAAAPAAGGYDASFDAAYFEPAYQAGADDGAAGGTAAAGGDAPDWGVDYGPARPLPAQDPAY